MRRTIVLSVGLAMLLASLGLQVLAGSGAGAAVTPTQVVTDLTSTEGFCSDAGARCKWIGNSLTAWGARLIFKIPLTGDGTKIGYEEGECVNLTKKSESASCFQAGNGARPVVTPMRKGPVDASWSAANERASSIISWT